VQALAFVPVAILVAIACVLTVRLAERRDLDAGLLPERTTRAASGRWLRGPTSLAVRLSRTTMLSWILGVSVYAFMFGALTRSATTMLSTSPAITAALGRLGVRRATDGFLDMAFFFDSVALALLAASIVGAMRDEEASGRLENLIVGPVTRTRWLIGRAGVGLCTLLLAALAAAVCTWFGATTQHLNPGLPRLLQAGLNAGAPSAFVLGLGVLVLGVRPRLTAAAAYGLVAWSVLVNLVGALVKNADWLKDSSLFSHIALAPAANVDWASDLVVVLLGLSATVVGAIWFNTRDISNA
jgi:ABC-2 type transport system permease protein